MKRPLSFAALWVLANGCVAQSLPAAPHAGSSATAAVRSVPPAAPAAPAEPERDDPRAVYERERWRAALEDYVPAVTPANVAPLGASAAPFATYLNQLHNRIHPLFACSFIASLSERSASDPLRKDGLYTVLEFVINPATGYLFRLGVVRTSGVRAFDIAALDAVHGALPFGSAPPEVVSPDGNVYVHWTFLNGIAACGTANAHPYILKASPQD